MNMQLGGQPWWEDELNKRRREQGVPTEDNTDGIPLRKDGGVIDGNEDPESDTVVIPEREERGAIIIQPDDDVFDDELDSEVPTVIDHEKASTGNEAEFTLR